MKYLMWIAAGLMGLTSAVHLFLGTGDIMSPIMQAETLDPAIRAIAMVVWHMVSLMLLLSTLAIAYLARTPNQALKWFVISMQVGFTLIFLFYNITHFAALFVLPQWTVFLIVPILMIFARPKAA
ncbi:MAG: hypothetical protein WBC85_10780 [Planktotalea sp.]|uniref:hypothetical protein n=1 Tax=Planktotalea sp. TaxID=2029877 RepID=UPI003C780FFF